MTTNQKLLRERRLRRRAQRMGYIVRKCRSRNSDSIGFGGYKVICVATNGIVLGEDFGAALDDLEAYFA
jgi:hypothetical protein